MEDIIKALLDVVRAQHSAAEGTKEEPFNMDDIVDMAMNIVGRPDESEEISEMVDSIQKIVETLAPDIFPPKTFEEMDDAERAASAASMIEERLRKGRNHDAPVRSHEDQEERDGGQESANMPEETSAPDTEEISLSNTEGASESDIKEGSFSENEGMSESFDGNFDARQAADLNDLIYKNLMEVMGLQNQQVEYPFDPSQIQYGREKSVTEMLEEERQAEEEQEKRPVSAWELAQNAVDREEASREKEPFIPQVQEERETKSASQLAAEAIRRSQEEDRQKLEIEKQAERLMEEAKKRGQDPMKFALHQQEILRYMEKNSDELVSFEDYEDLSPEEKLEIERKMYIEKQLEQGVHPDEVDQEVPEEFVPEEIKAAQAEDARRSDEVLETAGRPAQDQGDIRQENAGSGAGTDTVFTEEMLRQLSQEVLKENSAMILSENENEDMESLNEAILENIKQMMSGSGVPVPQENIGELLEQAAQAAQKPQPVQASQPVQIPETAEAEEKTQKPGAPSAGINERGDKNQAFDKREGARGMSAVELAKAAQQAAKPEQIEKKEGKSAVELAKEAQERAKRAKEEAEGKENQKAAPLKETETLQKDFSSGNEKQQDHPSAGEAQDETGRQDHPSAGEAQAAKAEQQDYPAVKEAAENETRQTAAEKQQEETSDPEGEKEDIKLNPDTLPGEEKEEQMPEEPSLEMPKEQRDKAKQEDEKTDQEAETLQEQPEDYEYVDPDELVLGEHTQAEIDEALENLNSLGLEGEVYERAKRMLLLELAGSEAELNAWLEEQKNGKKKKASVSALDGDDALDLDDFDEDSLEKELELAMDEDFVHGEIENVVEDSGKLEDFEQDAEKIEGGGETEEAEENAGETQKTGEDVKEAQKNGENGGKTEKIQKETDGAADAFSRKKAAKRKEKKAAAGTIEGTLPEFHEAEEKGYQVSVRHPFVLKNSASFIQQFQEYIADTQENRKLSTGFKKLDAMLRYGLHKGSYFIDSDPQYLKNSFMQQMADRAAESGVDVLYISTELSRYDLMTDTISRLSFEIHQGDLEKAVSVMSIMTGENGAEINALEDELNWYRGRISEHLYILDQEAVIEYTDSMEEASAGDILAELIRSIVKEGAHKPAVFIDNIANILSVEDSEDMKPLMDGIRKLAKELSIPIIMSYGYAQAENETELTFAEKELHKSLGNMCDVYMELQYAGMVTEDSKELTEDDICEMVEDGDTLPINVLLHRNRRPLKSSCQIQAAPKFNYFEE